MTTPLEEITDWHTNLWLPEHYSPEHREELSAQIRPDMDASPESHRAKVADVVDKFIVLALRWNQLGLCVPNEWVAEYVSEFPGRGVGFACIDPHDDDAPKQLVHAIEKLGLRGLKISPVYARYHPWDESVWKLYEIADYYRIPLLWHQSAAYPAKSTLENGNPVLLDKIARSFPELPMIIAHVGQPWVGEVVALLRKHKNLYADLSARYYRQWQCYNALMLAIDYGVTDRLLFGSDFPVQSPEEALASFRAINDWGENVTLPRVPDEVIEAIIRNQPFDVFWPSGI